MLSDGRARKSVFMKILMVDEGEIADRAVLFGMEQGTARALRAEHLFEAGRRSG
jgi:hypothetical protein